jgi:hypothetical protein
MEKPINFLTASGEELVTWYYCHPSDSPESLADLRDQTAAAVEAKVRGECADTLRDMESASHGYRRSSEEWQRRAERAEALVAKKENAIRVVEERLADAKREGAYAALMRYNDYLQVSDIPMNPYAYADKHYAPTPARSVTMSGWVVTYDAKRDYAWHAKAPGRATHQHTLAELIASMGVPKAPDTEYTALCALAEEDGNAL